MRKSLKTITLLLKHFKIFYWIYIFRFKKTKYDFSGYFVNAHMTHPVTVQTLMFSPVIISSLEWASLRVHVKRALTHTASQPRKLWPPCPYKRGTHASLSSLSCQSATNGLRGRCTAEAVRGLKNTYSSSFARLIMEATIWKTRTAVHSS